MRDSRYDYDPEFAQATPPGAPADTPPGAEARLEAYRDELDKAVNALARARDDELAAEEARDSAKRAGQFHPDCPKAGVFDGVRITVAYQKAWIEEYASGEESAYRQAKAARRAAADHLRKLEKQGGFQQSITASVREQYRGAGRSQW
jgi:hypothetical protein